MSEGTTDALAQAVWQVLDDMGTSGTSCCLWAKAKLRVAFEPFVTDPEEVEDWITLEEAQRIAREVENG